MKYLILLSLILLSCSKIQKVNVGESLALTPFSVKKVVKQGCEVKEDQIVCVDGKTLYNYKLGRLKAIKTKKEATSKEILVINSQTCKKEYELVKCGKGHEVLVWEVGALKSYKSL